MLQAARQDRQGTGSARERTRQRRGKGRRSTAPARRLAPRTTNAGWRWQASPSAEAANIAAWLRQGPWGGSSWPPEAELAFARDPPGYHIAARDGAYLAFACQGCNRRAWFGPMGTLESERRRGVGTVLLQRCLADLRAAGHGSAQIGWVGPVPGGAAG